MENISVDHLLMRRALLGAKRERPTVEPHPSRHSSRYNRIKTNDVSPE